MADRIIKIVIASPSDVIREKELLTYHLPVKFAKDKYEEYCNARIMVYDWEDIPSQSGYAQDNINSQLIKKADIILALFRHKLGSATINTKTGKIRSQSGTAEELLIAIERNKAKEKPLAMAYYYEKPPVFSIVSFKQKNEWNRLEDFKKKIKNEIQYKIYNDNEEKFLLMVCKDICENIQMHPLLVK